MSARPFGHTAAAPEEEHVMHPSLEAATDLQLRYRAWPSQMVTEAVHSVLYGSGRSIETVVIANLVGRWVTGEFEFVAPPLPHNMLAAIRRRLERQVN